MQTDDPQSDTDDTRGGPSSGRRALLKLLVLALLVGGAVYGAYVLGLHHYRDPAQLVAALREARHTPGIPVLFLLGYTAATAVGLPGTPLMLAGGAIFGLGWGMLMNWAGAILGATAAYGLARALGRDALRRLLGARAVTLDRLSARHGFVTVFRLRLVPVVPFIALNYGSALAGVRVRDYLPATILGIFPAVAVYTFFADALIAGVAGARQQAMTQMGVASGLLIALSFAPTIIRKLRA